MTGRKGRPGKHVPQRTCVGCRAVAPKRSLIRVVYNQEGVLVDPTGKMNGRGAYLHARRRCWERGLRGSLAHALKTEISAEDKERLRAYLETLPEESVADDGDPPGSDANAPVTGQTSSRMGSAEMHA